MASQVMASQVMASQGRPRSPSAGDAPPARRFDDRSVTEHYDVVIAGAVNPALTATAGAIRVGEHLLRWTS
jgi:hypothetical protein